MAGARAGKIEPRPLGAPESKAAILETASASLAPGPHLSVHPSRSQEKLHWGTQRVKTLNLESSSKACVFRAWFPIQQCSEVGFGDGKVNGGRALTSWMG